MTITRVRQGGVWVKRNAAPIDPSPDYDYVVEPGDDTQAAVTAAPTGATILFKPGVHRPNALNPKTGQTLVGQAGTIFDGSTALTSFTSDGTGHYYAAVTLPDYTESTAVQCEISTGTNANPCRKREQVWVDGVHLDRVMALSELNLASEFYQDYAADRVYFSYDPTGHSVMMASKAHAVSTSNTIRMTGIKVRYYAPPSQLGAVYLRGSNSEVDHCEISDVHAIGVFLDGANGTVIHDNTIHHVGQLGIGSHASHNARFAANYLHHNNTDGYRPDDWESGDIKFTWSDGVIVEDNLCEDSRGLAIWGDIENGLNAKCYIRRNTIRRCYADGIRYEIGYNCEISNNTIEYSGFQFAADHAPEGASFTGYSGFGTAAINVNTSRDVEVHHNVLGPNQNGIFAQFRPRADATFPNRDLVNFNAHDNDVTMVPYTLLGKAGNSYTSGLQSGEGVSGLNTLMGSSGIPTPQYYDGTKGNRFNSNTYRVSSTGRLQYAWNQGYRSFATFQSAGQEALGVQVAAPRPGFQISAGGDDGNWHTFDATGYYSASGTKIYIGDNSAVPTDADRCAWLRFFPHIPAGATITAAQAFLFLYATGLSGVAPNMLIDAEKTINAAQPTSKANVAGRARTTAQVAWPSPTWTSFAWQQSPSIHTILQELVNQPGWTVDSPVLLFLRDNQPGNVSGQISFNAYETDPALSANLQAKW